MYACYYAQLILDLMPQFKLTIAMHSNEIMIFSYKQQSNKTRFVYRENSMFGRWYELFQIRHTALKTPGRRVPRFLARRANSAKIRYS